MATARHDTAAQIINDAAVEEGIAEATDPFASTLPEMVRMRRLLSSAGRELVSLHQWPHLRKVCDITAALGDGRAWTLPADFLGYIDGTAWNQTQDQQILGPISAAQWQRYEASGDAPFTPSFRFIQGVFAVVPSSSVTDADLIQYEYHGKSWVAPAGQTAPTEDRVTAATDVVWFPSSLARIALRRAWKLSNGFDTTSIEGEYLRALDSAMSAENAAAVFSVVPVVASLLPSVPESNWTI